MISNIKEQLIADDIWGRIVEVFPIIDRDLFNKLPEPHYVNVKFFDTTMMVSPDMLNARTSSNN